MPGRGGVLSFIERVLWSSHRDLFTVQLASALLLARFGVTGLAGKVLGRILRGALGAFLEFGILQIDLLLDAIREGQKLKEFESIAGDLWERAKRGRKTEEEKQKLREEYLAILRKIGPVGSGPRPR